jgi:hypothetical protein
MIQAATAVSNRRDTLISIFDRIENVFRRLETYIEVPRTPGMIHAIVKVMVEVLCILAIVTKAIKENYASELILARNVSIRLSLLLEGYLKKLMGRTDVEDALLRLENVVLEETRMAAAEALKGIHVLQGIVEDRMRGVEGKLQGVGDILQGMKDIGQKGINSARITVQLVASFSIFIWSDTEVDESIRINVDDEEVHGIQDAVEGVQDDTRNVDNGQGIIEDLGARVIDGAHVILNQYSSHPERLIFLGDRKMARPIASDWDYLSRG